MDALAPRHVGAGVFRPLMHVIAPDAPQIVFNGIPLWFAACGAVCVPVRHALKNREWCEKCLAARKPSTSAEQFFHDVRSDHAPEPRVVVFHGRVGVIERRWSGPVERTRPSAAFELVASGLRLG